MSTSCYASFCLVEGFAGDDDLFACDIFDYVE
jgi:hypothetical protein